MPCSGNTIIRDVPALYPKGITDCDTLILLLHRFLPIPPTWDAKLAFQVQVTWLSPFGFLLTVCFTFKTEKLNSTVVSVPMVWKSSLSMSEIRSPLVRIIDFCCSLSVSSDIPAMVWESSRTLANVSTMAMVVSVATGDLRIVAIMYSPRSLNAFGGYFKLSPRFWLFKVEIFDLE